MKTRSMLLIFGGAAIVMFLLSRYTQTGRNIVNTITQAGIDMIAHFEGFAAHKYNDPPGSNLYSIGYGHQIQPGENFAEPMSIETAKQLLAQDTVKAQAIVRQAIKVELTPAQFDALTSLVYNIGAGNFLRSSVPALVNAGNFAAAAEAMKQHNKAHINGVLTVLPALVARREKEASAFV